MNKSKPGAKNNYALEKERHFCILRKLNLDAYSTLGFVDSNKNSIYEDGKEMDRNVLK